VSVTLYRIKLYGHAGENTELFSKNLAAILDIDAERARALLLGAPAIIEEGIEKEKAEEFCKQLESIRALCIVEPLDGEISQDGPSAATGSTPLPASHEVDDFKKKAGLQSWIWLVALVTTVGAFLLLAAGGTISSFWHLYRQNRAAATSPAQGAQSAPSEPAPAAAEAGSVSVEDLLAQIDALNARLESERFTLAQTEEVLAGLYRSPRSQTKEFEEQALIIRDLRDQIRADSARLQTLLRKLEEIQGGNE